MKQREADHADQRAEHRAGGGDAHRAAGQALPRERVAVEARRGRGRRARDVEQDRRARAAVDRADVGADQDQQRLVGRQLDRQRGHQRQAHRRGQAGQRADRPRRPATQQRVEDDSRRAEARDRDARRAMQSVEHRAVALRAAERGTGARTRSTTTAAAISAPRRRGRDARRASARARASANSEDECARRTARSPAQKGSAADQAGRVAERQRQRAAATRRLEQRLGRRAAAPARRAPCRATRARRRARSARRRRSPGTRPGAVYSVGAHAPRSGPCASDADRIASRTRSSPPRRRRSERGGATALIGACAPPTQGLGMPTVSGDTLALPAACCVQA